MTITQFTEFVPWRTEKNLTRNDQLGGLFYTLCDMEKHAAKSTKTPAIIILVIQSADEQRLVKKQANNLGPLFGVQI